MRGQLHRTSVRQRGQFTIGIMAAVVACRLASAVELPQDYAYQKVIRAHLATLAAEDFAVPLKQLQFRDVWVQNDDDLYRLWVLAQSFPATNGIVLTSNHFLLSSIESDAGIRMRAGGRGSFEIPGIYVDPMDLLWWATWDFRGNPYRGSRGIRNRAFVIAAVDMVMLDNLQESGTHWVNNARRSDYLGGALIWMAYVYSHVKRDLPAPVQAAYETGLAKFVARLTEWGPTGVNDNMDMHALVAAAYLEKALGPCPLVVEARAYCQRALKHIHPAGMVRDLGGLDASYNGIALYNLTWALAISDWPELREAHHRMLVLKGLLTLPEPDGKHFWGPSHFSTRTSADSANDQWAFNHREIAMAMRDDEALYLMFGGRQGRTSGWAVPEPSAMSRAIVSAIEKVNKVGWAPNEEGFTRWDASWWGTGRFNYAYVHYMPGFYRRLRAIKQRGDPRMMPPFGQSSEPFVRVFPAEHAPEVSDRDRDAFVIARFPKYAAAVYTGPIGSTPYMNFAGGALSYFWTADSGPVILGRTGKPVTPEASRQTWADWRLWPTHAMSGETESGEAFSSARIRRRVATVAVTKRPDGAVITFCGPIGKLHDDSRAAQNGCIQGDVVFERTFAIGERGVAVRSKLTGDGKDKIRELCEVIPLPIRDAIHQVATAAQPQSTDLPHRVILHNNDGPISEAAEGNTGIMAVEVRRANGGCIIKFKTPQTVRLGEEWEDPYLSRMIVQNLIVELHRSRDGAVPVSEFDVQYLITPLPPRPLP